MCAIELFLNGGGGGEAAREAYQRFGAAMDKTKPLLYIPLAMEPEQYPGCLRWITGELESLGMEIHMVCSGEELAGLCLADFGGVFIGGGNTYKLLADLKSSGAFAKLKAYLESGGPVFGGSAGAIIFGADIDTCQYADENTVGLADTAGFDMLGGASLLCHYGNEGEEATQRHTGHLLGLSQAGRRILALPEEDTVILHGGKAEVIGGRPYALFDKGQRVWRQPGEAAAW